MTCKCRGRKFILEGKKWIPCICVREYKKELTYIRSSIPPFFFNYTWTDFFKDFSKMRNIVRLCKKLIRAVVHKNRCKFLYVLGDANTGKQALICLILKEMIAKNLTCRIVNLTDLIQMEFDKEQKQEANEIYYHVDVVCLRIGTVMKHGYSRYVLEKFYTARRNHKKFAIFSTRLDFEHNRSLYGEMMGNVLDDKRKTLKIVMR